MAGLITDLSAIGSIDRTTDVLEIVDVSANTSNKVTVNNLVGITGGSVLSTTDTQTVQNKTLDNTNIITVKATNLVIQDGSDITKQAKFIASGITAGNTRSYTLPDASTTLVGTGVTQTLTNKTLTSPTITGGTIDNATITVDSVAGHTSATIVTIANLQISNGVLNTNNSVVTANLTDAAVTPAKLVAGTGTGWAWQNWTPTYANISVGNGTVVAKYIQTGKLVQFHWSLTFGSTSTYAASQTISFPVTAASYHTNGIDILGNGIGYDSSAVAAVPLYAAFLSTTTFYIRGIDLNAVFYNTTSTVPYTWAVGDVIQVAGTYEAA